MLPLLIALVSQVAENPYIACDIEVKGSIARTRIKDESQKFQRTDEYSGQIHGYLVETRVYDGGMIFTFVADMNQKNSLRIKSCSTNTAKAQVAKVFRSEKCTEFQNITFTSNLRQQPLSAIGGEVTFQGVESTETNCSSQATPPGKLPSSGLQGQIFPDLEINDDKVSPPILKFEGNSLWMLRNAGAAYTCVSSIDYNHKKNQIEYLGSLQVRFDINPKKRVSSF